MDARTVPTQIKRKLVDKEKSYRWLKFEDFRGRNNIYNTGSWRPSSSKHSLKIKILNLERKGKDIPA
jgi:hypothetical protein